LPQKESLLWKDEYLKIFFKKIIPKWNLDQWFIWQIFTILQKIFWKLIFCHKFQVFFKGKKIATIAYNMKGYLRFSTFIFWISPNLAMYTYGMIPTASDTAITEILKHGLQVPICGSAPQMSSPRSEQTTRAATIFAYTHTHTRRSLAAGAAAGVQACELLPNLPPSSSTRLQMIGSQLKIHQRPSIYLFWFLKKEQTILNSCFSPAEARVCPWAMGGV
jgi:hypothetical protein